MVWKKSLRFRIIHSGIHCLWYSASTGSSHVNLSPRYSAKKATSHCIPPSLTTGFRKQTLILIGRAYSYKFENRATRRL